MSKNNKYKVNVNKSKKGTFKIVIIVLIALVFLSAAGVGGFYYYKMEKQKAQAQMTQFRTCVNEILNENSAFEGIEYKLDEKYYDEEAAKIFVTASYIKQNGIDEEKITKQQIKDSLNRLFYFIPTEQSVCNLVQKPKLTLLEECTDIIAMSYMDYKYIGAADEQLNKKSKGTFIYQNNPELKNMPYGTSDMFSSGCGPIALTMAINYVKGKDTVLLEDVAKWAIDNDMYVENEGTMWALMREYPESIDVDCEEVYVQSVEEFEHILPQGQAMVTSMSKGHFTNNGHFITVIGANDGKVDVLDSSSIFRSNKQWDSKTVFDESNKYFWVIK